ncbi:MAG TPA: hypothetical protein VE569_06480, partial [Acidimicrobiia bacterium]|nr:hypothetical protein [Acidimicrobiia bacterium]
AILVSLVALTVWAWRERPEFAEVAVLALIAFVLFNKVFKPQYVLWLLPLFAWNGVKRSTVRLVEGTAIVHMAVTYFSLRTPLVGLMTAIRVGALVVIAGGIFRNAHQASVDNSPPVLSR